MERPTQEETKVVWDGCGELEKLGLWSRSKCCSSCHDDLDYLLEPLTGIVNIGVAE